MGQAMGKAAGRMMDALAAFHEVIAPAVVGDPEGPLEGQREPLSDPYPIVVDGDV